MNRALNLMLCVLLLSLIASQALAEQNLQQARLSIPDMVCMSCEMRVEEAMTSVGGVAAVSFEPGNNIALVTFDPEQVKLEAILAACAEAGYPASLVDNTET
ncbi:MAG: heavy-metal-associated domain-containing protein [Wenzhouxiangella sp.]